MTRLRIWVTRTQPGAWDTARRLLRAGHAPNVAPVLRVEWLPIARPPRADYLVFTSINGVDAFVARSTDRSTPVFAVARATAARAELHGFDVAAIGSGDVDDLYHCIIAKAPRDSRLVHVGAVVSAGNLVARLRMAGLDADSCAVYQTTAAPVDVKMVTNVLSGKLDAVLVHSPKGAEQVKTWLAPHGALSRLSAYCISPAAAAPLVGIVGQSFVASAPNEEKLLALFN